MIELSTEFAQTTVERRYDAAPAVVFAALTSRDAMLHWASPGPDFTLTLDPYNPTAGGSAVLRMETKDADPWVNEDRFHEVVPPRRIIQTSHLRQGVNLLFAGVVVYDLQPDGTGTHLTLTEHGVFPDGRDSADMHEAGWGQVLDQLGAHLSQA